MKGSRSVNIKLGSIKRLNYPVFEFNEEQANEEIRMLQEKFENLRKPGHKPTRAFFDKKTIKKKDNLIENKILRSSLMNNKEYMFEAAKVENNEILSESKVLQNESFVQKKERDKSPLDVNPRLSMLEKIYDQSFFTKNDMQSTKQLQTYDCFDNDKTPEEWVNICQNNPERNHAWCPIYVNGRYIWVPCKVTEYNEKKKKFLVKVVDTNNFKFVGRLSLLFEMEDKKKFKERVEGCKVRQKKADDELRFAQYVQGITQCNSVLFKDSIKKKILSLVADKKKDARDPPNHHLLQKIMKEVETSFLIQIKKFYALREMSNPNLQQKFKNLRIELRLDSYRIPYYGTIGKLSFDKDDHFKIMRDTLKMDHLCSKKRGVECLLGLKKKTINDYIHHKLFEANFSQSLLPFELVAFSSLQKNCFFTGRQNLNNNWKEFLTGEISEILDNKDSGFDMNISDYGIYSKEGKNQLQRLLKMLDLNFSEYFKQIIKSNIDGWISFIQKFTKPNQDEAYVWDVMGKPLIKIELSFKELKRRGKKKKKEEGEIIFYVPSKENIVQELTAPIHWMTECTTSVSKLEHEIVRMVSLDRLQAYNLSKEDAIIQKACQKIKDLIEEGFREPEEILLKFQDYQFLFEKSIDEVIKLYFQKAEDQSLEEMDAYLKKVADSILKIKEICINEKNSMFFQIKTGNLKQALMTRATETLNTMLAKIADLCTEQIDSIDKNYKKLETDLVLEPKTEEQLVALQNLLKVHEEKLKELDSRVDFVSDYLTLLEKYSYTYKSDHLTKYWLLKISPTEVRLAVSRGKNIASTYEQQFLNKLDRERKDFETVLTNLRIELDGIKSLNNLIFSQNSGRSDSLNTRFENALDTVKSFKTRETMFGMQNSNYEDLDAMIAEFIPYKKLWDLAGQFETERDIRSNEPLINIKYKEFAGKINNIYSELNVSIRRFNEEENTDEALAVCSLLKKEIEEFKMWMPYVESLTKDAIKKKDEYWREIMNKVNLKDYETKRTTTTLSNLKSTHITDYYETVLAITSRADREYSTELKFSSEIRDKLKQAKIELIFDKNLDVYLVQNFEDFATLLDELFNLLLLLEGSPYVAPIKKNVEDTKKKLITCQDLLTEWKKYQRDWIYLEPIFRSDEIGKQLPREKKKFDAVNKYFRKKMEDVEKERAIFESLELDVTKSEMEKHNAALDEIQKNINDYLETKRTDFPRFYFLSDDELIEILAKTKDPTTVTKYMNKCFEGIDTVEFNNNLEVINMISSEKEKIFFIHTVNVNEGDKKGNVERWMIEIESVMKKTLKVKGKEAMADVDTLRVDWVRKWPGQIVLAVNSVRWTKGVEDSIENNNIDLYEKVLDAELLDIVNLVRGELTQLERLTISALIVLDVHAKYVVNELVVKGVESLTDFEWIAQLRYYHDAREDTIKSKMITSELKYQYEYLGNSSRLVITPLTDRCYRTLMCAIQFYYGGAPEGPAGTGKTETVKDLAKAIAVLCVVFNCSDQLNVVAMSKFFKGLASSGAWCCFDEFNRIEPEVLSVIAEQVRKIQNAIRSRVKRFWFEDSEILLITSCAINITMNPSYAGRAELPDNLKALFRPCAMMVPDYSLISEINLFSNGFEKAPSLAAKVVASLKLSSEQLSTQKHYDFGMRALKAILVAAGNLKRVMQDTEERIVLKALNDVNIPKFTLNDIPLFESITSDLFPNIECPTTDYSKLESALSKVSFEKKIIPEPIFVKKCIQLYETILVRHGLMLVGLTCSGKTEVWKCLKRGLCLLHGNEKYLKTKAFKLNPKSITSAQLYGRLDPDTKAWTDGVLPEIMRACENDASNPERKWVIFDGPVDAVWIENMNTVLDDNKVLCLTNGQKIKVTPQTNLIFEVEDLINASPATVSRCGMVYLEPVQLGWLPLIKSFSMILPECLNSFQDYVFQTMKWFIDPCITYIRKLNKFPMVLQDQQLVLSSIRIMKIYLQEYFNENPPEVTKEIEAYLNNIIAFSIIWSLGVAIEESARMEFHLFFLKLICFDNVVENYNLDLKYEGWQPRGLNIKIGDPQSIYQIVFDKSSKKWAPWTSTESPYEVPKGKFIPYNELIIPTAETIRTSFLLKLFVNNLHHVMLVGPTGTAKTICVMDTMNKSYNNTEYANILTVFSGQTTQNQVQKMIESKMTGRRARGRFAPEEGKKNMIVFIDDINMPVKETYGAQPPIEILRMWLEYGYWYDLDTREKKYLIHMQFIGAMGPPSTGRNTVTNRFTKHFNVIYVEPFDGKSLQNIFSTILEWFFLNIEGGKLSRTITDLKDNIVLASIELYQKIKISKELLPTPSKQHYVYNLRDISKVFQGITRASKKSFSTDEDFVKLWAHECIRVFQDRLINEEDQNYFLNILKKIMESKIKKTWSHIVKYEPLLWASFIPTIYPDGDTSKKPFFNVYCELTNRDNLLKYSKEFLDRFNESNPKKMNIVLFMRAIEHIIKIVRIIQTPYGHGMLVGIGGSGRKSMTLLSCYIAEFGIFKVNINRNYDFKKDWPADLIRLMKIAGIENKPVVFLFNDTQILKDDILEDISSILNNGEVPSLFSGEEKAQLLEDINNTYPQAENLTIVQKINFFTKKCKDNLHMIITMSPVGNNFRRRIRTFPSLINCSTIDWFLTWPKEALKAVADNVFVSLQLEAAKKEKVAKLCVDFQEKAVQLSEKYLTELRSYNYITPTSYLELLNVFKSFVLSKKKKLDDNIVRYESGLKKLAQAQDEVQEKQKEIIELKPILQSKSEETKKMMENLEVEQKKADIEKKVCEKEQAESNIIREEASKLRDETMNELKKAETEMAAVKVDLMQIKGGDISFIKALPQPSKSMHKLYQVFCIVFKVKPKKIKDPNNQFAKIDDWKTPASLEIFNKTNLITILQNFGEPEVNALTVEQINALSEIIEKKNDDPEDDFTYANLARITEPAAKLGKWVMVVAKYWKNLQVVKPKREALAVAEQKLAVAEASLAEKQSALKLVLDMIEQLKSNLDQAKKEKNNLEVKLETNEKRLTAAKKLLEGLKNEKINWTKRAEELKNESINVVGDILLSSGIIAYLGVFPFSYRLATLDYWKDLLEKQGITCSEKYSFRYVMCDEIKIGNWVNKYSLPNDSLSIDNAIIYTNSTKCPLMIDPQVQANKWIKEMYQKKVKILKLTSSSQQLIEKLQFFIENGDVVLVEDIEETIDTIFDPVLDPEKVETATKVQIKYKEEQFIDLHPDFRLMFTTKLPRPHYTPEICVKTTLLNFTVTPEGLEDQLLNILVGKEDPGMKKHRQNNVEQFSVLKENQLNTEKKILTLLQDSEGNILDNEYLINTLNESKKESQDSETKLTEIRNYEERWIRARKISQDVGNRAANYFFCVMDLANIERMYQYSLEWFIELYKDAIDEEPKVKETRVSDIIRIFQSILFSRISRSLFEKDKFLFSFLLFLKLQLIEKKATQLDFRQLFIGSTATKSSKPNPTGDNGWLSEKQWAGIVEISHNVQALNGFDDIVATNINEWETFYNSSNPQKAVMPGGYRQKVSIIHQLMILRMFRPDKIVPAITEAIELTMGREFIDPPGFNLAKSYEESRPDSPIIFILSPGLDPQQEIVRLAELLGRAKYVDILSLGQGQGKIADRRIEDAKNSGRWVILQNCHLSPKYLQTIIGHLEGPTDQNFRLWLTSMPSPDFPVSLLQNGVKITNEPPKGLKNNMLRIYQTFDPRKFEEGTKPGTYKKLLFGLTFFHALIQERRKFGSLGWNISYEFSQMDYKISQEQLKTFVNDYSDIPFKTLNYIVGDANYGGRVTDPMDRRLLSTILLKFFNEDILSENYTFSKSGNYYSPPESSLEGYKDLLLNSFPLRDQPEVFGLDDNAEITSGINGTNQIMSLVLSLQPRSASGDGVSSDKILIEKCEEYLSRLPKSFDLDEICKNYPVLKMESMNTVLQQEILRFNKLLGTIRYSLEQLQKAIEGFAIITVELEEVYDKLLLNIVPEAWHKHSYPSLKPLSSWMDDFLSRLNFMQTWINEGQPKSFWISGFFFTQSFLTGTLQNYARQKKLPIDSIEFDFEVLDENKEITEKPPFGCYVYGLYLEGASWDNNRKHMVESQPKILYHKMPYIWLRPSKNADLPLQTHNYNCPVYKTAKRAGELSTTGHSTNYVLSIKLKMDRNSQTEDYWIQRGAALLCQLSD